MSGAANWTRSTSSGGYRVVDPDLTLEFKSGARLDLEAVDELARDLYGLDQNFSIELVPAEQLREETGKAHADGVHRTIAGENWHSIALADHLTAEEASVTLAHEFGHAAHSQGAVSHKAVTAADVDAYDRDAEAIADTYEKAYATSVYRRAFLTGYGGAPSSGSGLKKSVASASPAAESASAPDALDWAAATVRHNRESEELTAVRRVAG